MVLGPGQLILPPRSLRLCLAPELVEHVFKQGLQVPSRMTLLRSRLELDLATMVFCRRFILNSQSQWYSHLRADSSPQGGRDYFICEYDHVKIGSALDTGKQHVSRLLESGTVTLTTRLLPLSIIGSRAASATHKGKQLLRALALDSDSLQASIARCMSLMFDFGAESGQFSQKFSNRT